MDVLLPLDEGKRRTRKCCIFATAMFCFALITTAALMGAGFGTGAWLKLLETCHHVYSGGSVLSSGLTLDVSLWQCPEKGRVDVKIGRGELQAGALVAWAPLGCCPLREKETYLIPLALDAYCILEINEYGVALAHYGPATNITRPIVKTFDFPLTNFL